MPDPIDPSEFAPPENDGEVLPPDGPFGGVYADEVSGKRGLFSKRDATVNRVIGGAATAMFLLVLVPLNVLCLAGLLGAALFIARNGLDVANLDPSTLGGDFFALTFFSGFMGLTLSGVIMGLVLGWRPKNVLGLRIGRPIAYLPVFLGALTVGFLPGWIAEKLWEIFPDLQNSGTLELIPKLLTEGSTLDTVAMILTICVGAPLFEELCFRGILWNTAERVIPGAWGQAAAFVLSSMAFAVVHADPVQSPALLFTAFFLGWMRLTTGSVWPGVLAHFVNNTLAVVMTYVSIGYELEGSMPWWLVFPAALFTLTMAGLLYLLRSKPLVSPESSWLDQLVTRTEEDLSPS